MIRKPTPLFWVIIIAILILIVLLGWWFWPKSKPAAPQPSALTKPPIATVPPPAAYQPTTVQGLHLNRDKNQQLSSILQDEDKKIQKILASQSTDKPGEIRKVREADQAKLQKLLSTEQYHRLVIAENEHDGEMLTP